MHLFKRAKPRPSVPKPRSSAAVVANRGLCLRDKVCGGRPHPAPGRKVGLSGADGVGQWARHRVRGQGREEEK